MFYDSYVSLCNNVKKAPSAVAVELGLSRASVNGWKNGKIPTDATLHKVADYFGISVSELMSDQIKKAPALNEKDRRDIAHDVDNLMDKLEHSGDLMFDGDPMSDEAKESLRAAMKLGLEAAKIKNKERFTPKKYRGKE